MPLHIKLELLSACPCIIGAQRCYILIISCALVICPIYTPEAHRPQAGGLRVYISEYIKKVYIVDNAINTP